MKNKFLTIIIINLAFISISISQTSILMKSRIEKDIPDRYYIDRLIPINIDNDNLFEYVSILKVKEDSFDIEQNNSIILFFYDYQNKWKKIETFTTKISSIESDDSSYQYEIIDTDSDGLDEIKFTTYYMYANGRSESSLHIIKCKNNIAINICQYMGTYYSHYFDEVSNTFYLINTEDLGFWNCLYIFCSQYQMKNGYYVPIKEVKSDYKYSFDKGQEQCKDYTNDAIKKEFGIKGVK